jgi:hypothetical protein
VENALKKKKKKKKKKKYSILKATVNNDELTMKLVEKILLKSRISKIILLALC